MENLYSVAVHFEEDNGYIEYDIQAKTVNVVLKTPEKKAEVEAYLTASHEINVPKDTLMDFEKRVIQPLNSLEELKLALTRMWDATEVYVDWSRPVGVEV
ncbi:hypothetical protein [Anaerosinus gibii]|uniref:Uncharacterized protein n=1 Tax=Selenobaculum gibii TaxID=3054208 RepID=A0A9Y2AIL7_9FIRM|nr:hypothetical protein [Selenobaculum gbiensis]WIW70461.1 hypothetical protein P3F81_11320 [Selenobaculum gbiensis]